MKVPSFAVMLVLLAASIHAPLIKAAGPAAALATKRSPSDDRLTFLTLQLSSAEESIKAINAAMKAAGYKALVASDKVEGYEKGNELMDRKGGAPVPWDQFYGKTAAGFYYHSSAELHIDKGRGATVVDAQYNGSRLTHVDRPKQFDYLCKANNEQAAKAKEEIARMDKKLDSLLARRRQLEAEQIALWATISLETIASREIGFQPLYRFKLQAGPQSPTTRVANDGQLQIVRALVLYLRIADRAAAQAVEVLPDDRDKATKVMRESIDGAYVQLQESVLAATATADLPPAAAHELKEALVTCKSAQTYCKNAAEAHRLALEGDAAGDEPRKQTFRGQLQQSLIGFAEATADLDDSIAKLAASWNVRGEPGVNSPDQLPAPGVTPASSSAPISPATGPASDVEIAVPAIRAENDPVATGIHLAKGQGFVINPNVNERWAKGGGTHKGRLTDYRGYTVKPGWMAMKWKIGGSSGTVSSGDTVVAPESGDLFLFCSDDKPGANTGVIHAVVSLSPAAPANASESAITITPSVKVHVIPLEREAPRLYDSNPLRKIEGLDSSMKDLQFTSIPQRVVISYTVKVNKPGTIYAFGAKQSDFGDTFGEDRAKWESASKAIRGIHVDFVYRRTVTAGEKLSVRGFEVQLAAESIKIQPASPADDGPSGSIFNDKSPAPLARVPPPPQREATSLFDGKSLAGWEGDSHFWSVADGSIHGKSSPKTKSYLYTKGAYQNFRLDLQFKFISGNSGIVFRAEPAPDYGFRSGYEADIYLPNAIGKLAFNEESLFRPEPAVQNQVFKPDAWNQYSIEAQGDHIRFWINGTLVTDATHHGAQTGRIGLQVFTKTEVFFRDIQIRELP